MSLAPRASKILLLGLLCLGSGAFANTTAQPSRFADADDPATVRAGKVLYAERCSRCHGRRLQGQALWQLRDRFEGQRAPAHDETGHTWQHSDEELWQITRSGRLPGRPSAEKSYMPAFEDILDDKEILEVLAFIKARWSTGIRAAQASLNPGLAGMPRDAASVEWTLPPNCSSTLQYWRSESR